VEKVPAPETAQERQEKTVEGMIRRALKAAGLLR
jgi:hypothetical protein